MIAAENMVTKDAMKRLFQHVHWLVHLVQVLLLERSSRSHLTGFADLHADGGDRLYVLYKWQDRFFEMDGAI